MFVTKETEVTADSHDDVKKLIEAETLKEGYTKAKVDYISTTVIPDPEEPEDDFVDFPTIYYP